MTFANIRPVFVAVLIAAAGLFTSLAVPVSSVAETAAPSADAAPPAPVAAPPSTPAPAESGPTAATPVSPPAPASPPVVSAPAPAPAPDAKTEPDSKSTVPGVSGDATVQMLEIPSRPVALLRGKSDWENGFKSIQKSLAVIEGEVTKAGLKQGGKPIAVFVETDDNGFAYEAMVPLTKKPEGKDQLGNDVKIGSSPSGKAIKFQHRGAYDDIDSTYDLITAYLDEKGLEAQNLFIEEYLTDTKNADDQALEVDIYVFIK